MAGQGLLNFASGQVLTSAQVDGYLMQQSIPVFASTSARDSAYTAQSVTPADGMFCTTTDTNSLYRHDGSSWVQWATPWTTYSPTWTNFTPDSSTIVTEKRYLFGDLQIRVRVTLAGSFSISGTLGGILPDSVTADSGGGWGVGVLNDSGTQNRNMSVHVDPAGDTWVLSHNGGVVNGTSPHTWAVGDFFGFLLTVTPA